MLPMMRNQTLKSWRSAEQWLLGSMVLALAMAAFIWLVLGPAPAAPAYLTAVVLLIASLLAVAVLIMALAMWLASSAVRAVRRTTASLAAGAEEVVSAARQVAGAAQSLSQGAAEQAASLEETSASMEELATTTRQNAEIWRHSVSRPELAVPTGFATISASHPVISSSPRPPGIRLGSSAGSASAITAARRGFVATMRAIATRSPSKTSTRG